MSETEQGWAWPPDARRFVRTHYFVGAVGDKARSLCKEWECWTSDLDFHVGLPSVGLTSNRLTRLPDDFVRNCRRCRKMLARRRGNGTD